MTVRYSPGFDGAKLALRLIAAVTMLVSFMASSSHALAETEVVVGYLERVVPPPPVLSNLDPIPEDEGEKGVSLGMADNATTGKFLGHTYKVEIRQEEESDAFFTAARDLLAKTKFLIVHAPAGDLDQLAKLPEAKNALIFNVSASDDELRSQGCHANLFHTIPSRAMLADALAQFALSKRWKRWALISGTLPGDAAFQKALERAATKFRLTITDQKNWVFDADMRRNAAQEVPLFTQDFEDHDLLVIADENHDFGRYVMYNTWLPRPVAGSEGIAPVAWGGSVEQHGAAQLQSRFKDLAGRNMRSIDYAAWAAARAIGEAVTRTNSNEPATLRKFIESDAFELAGFKGRKLTFRSWNGQLRQPIPLLHPRAVVAIAPLEGFLHRRNEMDTLGLDEPESNCEAFASQQ